MQFPPPSHTDFRGQSSRGPYRGHTAGDVGPAAGGLAGEGGEDAVSDGATVLEGPGQVRKEDIAASEEAGLGFLFGERSDNHAAACDPMLLEVVT
jgi:hypothetical protein